MNVVASRYSFIFEMVSHQSGMRSVLLFASCVLTLDGLIREIQAVAQWDKDGAVVRQGDDVTLTCEVSNLGFIDVVRISVKDRSGAEQTIADNQNVKSPFSKRDRLRVLYSYFRNNSAATVLQFNGIQGEDAGSISCFSLSDEQNRATFDLQVLVPIQSVKFSVISPDMTERILDAEQEIVLVENTPSGVACTATVNGSLTPPEVRMIVNSEDRTDLFIASELSRVLEEENGAETFYSEMKLTYNSEKPVPDWNEKSLDCVAKLEGFPERTATASILVQYSPLVTCSRYEIYAKIGDKATLVCEVRANPSGSVFWKRNDEERVVENNSTLIMEKVIKPDISQMSLHFSSLIESHFATYTIVARNDHGSSEADVELLRRTSTSVQEKKPSQRKNPRNDPRYQVAGLKSAAGHSRVFRSFQSVFCILFATILMLTFLNKSC